MDDISKFYALVLPLGTPDTYCNVHFFSPSPNGKPFVNGYPAQGLSNFLHILDRTKRSAKARDIYFCLSSQARTDQKPRPDGSTFTVAAREQRFAVTMKSFYIDIDVKPGKPGEYQSPNEAMAALLAFCKGRNFPRPNAIVASGSGGFHVYWGLQEPVEVYKWLPLAEALKVCCRDNGLNIDPTATADSARILRAPGTFNYKTDPAKPVKLLHVGEPLPFEVMAEALASYVGVPELPPRMPTTEGSELGAGIDTGKPDPISLSEVVAVCPAVSEAVRNGGRDHAEPLWASMMCVAAHTVDPEKSAHTLSNQHPGYDPKAVDDKLDLVVKRQVKWPACHRIAENGAEECAKCPHLNEGKSPFHFARAVQVKQLLAAQAPAPPPPGADDDLPSGYSRNAKGCVLRTVHNEDGSITSVGIIDYPMTNAWMQDESSSRGWTLHFDTIIANRVKRFSASLEDLFGRGGVQQIFAAHGIPVRDNAIKALKDFLMAWTQKLQELKDAVVSSTPFGWSHGGNGKIDGFTYGGRVWSKTGDRPAADTNPGLTAQYSPHGDLKSWLDASRLVTDQRRPGLNAILAAAFAAPLVKFTGQTGVMLSMYSPESGIGKTTTMRIAQAVWGDPQKGLQGVNDTTNSVINKIGELKALPIFWDELKTEGDTQRFVAMSFQLSQGKEKSRLNADSSQRQIGTWNTMLVSASNDSLLEPIIKVTKSTTAGIYRLFEFCLTPGVHGQIEHTSATRILGNLNHNYGHAGLVYAKFLGTQYDRIDRELHEIESELARKVSSRPDERFWITTMATVLGGARYGNELGMTDIDVEELEEFLITVLGNMRKEIKESPVDMKDTMSIKNILAQFFKTMAPRHTLLTNVVHKGAGRPQPGSIKVLGDTSRLDRIIVQRGMDDRFVRVSSTELTRWMADHGYSRHAFTKALKDEFAARQINGRIGSGTSHAGGTEYLIEIDFNDKKLQDFWE